MGAVKQNETVEKAITRSFCTFRLSERLYGVDIHDVKEINTETDSTPIFHAPSQIRGYINIRGQIYLLLDLRNIFGFDIKKIDKNCRVVLFMPEVGDPFGVLVDSIEDVVTVDEERIENRRKKRETHDDSDRRGVDVGEGVCKLQDELLIILDARKLLHAVGQF